MMEIQTKLYEEVKHQMSSKVGTIDLMQELQKKANVSDVQSALESKANVDDVNEGLKLKANKNNTVCILIENLHIIYIFFSRLQRFRKKPTKMK